MDMTDLPLYDIPLEFIDVEFQKSDDSPTLKDLIKRQSEIRTNAYDYINGYKAMIFLEEAAEMKHLSKFKHIGIEIKYDEANESFYFKNEVSSYQIFVFCSTIILTVPDCYYCSKNYRPSTMLTMNG